LRRAAEQATFRDVFAIDEFRALWLAQILSVAGDQLARVALTVAVYERTRSPLLAAVTYAASIVPAFLGGVLLSGLADRLSRRAVMIGCDLARMLLVALMALPGMPVAALVALLFLVTMFGAPFASARSAIYPDVLTGDRYVLGTAITMTTYQFAQVLGFAIGGAVVGLLGTRSSLIVDAGTFAGSALLVRFGVRARPAARVNPTRVVAPLTDAISGARLVFGTAALRMPMLLGWLSAFYNVPEGIAAPLAHTLGGGPTAVGLILAAAALGASIGSIAFSRVVPPQVRQRWMAPLAVCACAVLIAFAFSPGLPAALAILLISGMFDCYQVAANAAFVAAAPPRQRGQAFGLAQAGMNLGQGTAMILAGAVSARFGPTAVIAATGAIGAIAALMVAVSVKGVFVSR
jgi:predicted MFS family arabinose efflux permease